MKQQFDYCIRCGGDLPHPIYHKYQSKYIKGRGMICPECDELRFRKPLVNSFYCESCHTRHKAFSKIGKKCSRKLIYGG